MSDIHSRWFRFVRYKLNINQRALANRLRLNQSLVSRIERGIRQPTEAQWQALAGVAGVSHADYWKGPPA